MEFTIYIELFSIIRNSSCLELCLQMISVHLWSKSTYIWKEQSFYIFTQISATALAITLYLAGNGRQGQKSWTKLERLTAQRTSDAVFAQPWHEQPKETFRVTINPRDTPCLLLFLISFRVWKVLLMQLCNVWGHRLEFWELNDKRCLTDSPHLWNSNISLNFHPPLCQKWEKAVFWLQMGSRCP